MTLAGLDRQSRRHIEATAHKLIDPTGVLVLHLLTNCWQITGKKTSAYRPVGNAFPAPVGTAAHQLHKFRCKYLFLLGFTLIKLDSRISMAC
jgi:hypothetical protein